MAFAELYAAQAGKLAEHMAKLRAKEVAQREAFKKHVERFIPTQASPACLPGQLLPEMCRLCHCLSSELGCLIARQHSQQH